MKSTIQTLLGKFKVANVSRKSVDEQFKLLLENLKGENLSHLADETTRLLDSADVKDVQFVELQTLLIKGTKDIKSHVPSINNSNSFSSIAAFAGTVIHHIEKTIVPDLQYEINSRLGSDNYVSAMKYDTFYVIRLTELCDFAVNYSAMLLHYSLKVHTDEVSLEKGSEVTPTNKMFLDRLNHYLFQYISVSNCLLSISGLKQKFQAIPPTLISSDEISDFSVSGNNTSDIDPFRMGFINVAWSPAYFIGKWIAESQNDRYKERRERANVIKLRLVYLKSVYNDRPDPNNERRIKLLEADLAKVEYAILQYEKTLWEDG